MKYLSGDREESFSSPGARMQDATSRRRRQYRYRRNNANVTSDNYLLIKANDGGARCKFRGLMITGQRHKVAPPAHNYKSPCIGRGGIMKSPSLLCGRATAHLKEAVNVQPMTNRYSYARNSPRLSTGQRPKLNTYLSNCACDKWLFMPAEYLRRNNLVDNYWRKRRHAMCCEIYIWWNIGSENVPGRSDACLSRNRRANNLL